MGQNDSKIEREPPSRHGLRKTRKKGTHLPDWMFEEEEIGEVRITQFNKAILLRIFSFLGERDLCSVAQVTRRFRKISEDNRLWKRLYLSVFPHHNHSFEEIPPQVSSNISPNNSSSSLSSLISEKASIIKPSSNSSSDSITTPHTEIKPSYMYVGRYKDWYVECSLREMRSTKKIRPEKPTQPRFFDTGPTREFRCNHVMSGTSPTVKAIRIVFLGAPYSGKSSLIDRFISGEFEQKPAPTWGAKFCSKRMVVAGQVTQVWCFDVGGQERYLLMASLWYKESSAAVLTYDITRPETVRKLKGWLKELQEKHPSIIICLVATKCDLESKKRVNVEEIKQMAKEEDFLHFETSAKEKKGIRTLFTTLVKECIVRRREQLSKLYPPIIVQNLVGQQIISKEECT